MPASALEDYSVLIDFIAEHAPRSEIESVAERVGVAAKVRYPEKPTASQQWQAVLQAALNENRSERFVLEIEKLIGEADRANYELAKRSCAEAMYQTMVRRRNPDLYSVSGGLAQARTLGEICQAGIECRELVLRILSTVEAGAGGRPILIAASSMADIDRLAEQIGTLALNLLTTVDRLLDLTELHDGHDSIKLHVSEHPDDFDVPNGPSSPDPQVLTLARNARNAAWQQLQRLLVLLTRNTIYAKTV